MTTLFYERNSPIKGNQLTYKGQTSFGSQSACLVILYSLLLPAISSISTLKHTAEISQKYSYNWCVQSKTILIVFGTVHKYLQAIFLSGSNVDKS